MCRDKVGVPILFIHPYASSILYLYIISSINNRKVQEWYRDRRRVFTVRTARDARDRLATSLRACQLTDDLCVLNGTERARELRVKELYS